MLIGDGEEKNRLGFFGFSIEDLTCSGGVVFGSGGLTSSGVRH